MRAKVYRSQNIKIIGGVCGGLSEYFDIDVVLIRALFIIAFIVYGSGLFAYLLLWIIIPGNKPKLSYKSRGIYE